MKEKLETCYNFNWIDSFNEDQKLEFKEALNSYIFFKKNSFDLTQNLIDKYPQLISPKILMMSLMLLSRDKNKIKIATRILLSVKNLNINEEQEIYLSVIKKWIEGDIYSVIRNLQKIILINPKDIFAIRLFHFNNIFTGIDDKFLKSHLQILKNWSDKDQFYNLILGMTSFAYEENNDYHNAFRLAKLSLDISKKDLWSWHALLHIHDSKLDNVIFLQNEYEKINWNSYGPMKRHMWWHQSLFYFYQKNYTKCLELYDNCIFSEDEFYLDFCNAISLLLRLNYQGIDIKKRIDKLKPLANYFKNQNLLPFIDYHLILFYKYLDDQEYFNEFNSSIKFRYEKSYLKKIFKENLLPLTESIVSKKKINEELIKSNFIKVGGSFAQREIIYLDLYQSNNDKKFKDKIYIQIKNKKNSKILNYV